jgi:hypothetical protein
MWRTLAWRKALQVRALERGPNWESVALAQRFGACDGEAGTRVRLSTESNIKRAAAPETANGCARGAKLWREKPHERIWHEIGPAGSGRMKAS